MGKNPFQSASANNKEKGLKAERPNDLSKEMGSHERWWWLFLNQTRKNNHNVFCLIFFSFFSFNHSIIYLTGQL